MVSISCLINVDFAGFQEVNTECDLPKFHHKLSFPDGKPGSREDHGKHGKGNPGKMHYAYFPQTPFYFPSWIFRWYNYHSNATCCSDKLAIRFDSTCPFLKYKTERYWLITYYYHRWSNHMLLHLKYARQVIGCAIAFIQLNFGTLDISNITRHCAEYQRKKTKFLPRPCIHEWHPTPRPYGRAMGCLSWIISGKMTVIGSVLVCFPQRTQRRRRIARPGGRDMKCILWVHRMNKVFASSLSYWFHMLYSNVIYPRVYKIVLGR